MNNAENLNYIFPTTKLNGGKMFKFLMIVMLIIVSDNSNAQHLYHPATWDQGFLVCADSGENLCQTVAANDSAYTTIVALGAISKQLETQQATSAATNTALASVTANQVVLNAQMQSWMKRAEGDLRQSIDEKFKNLPKELTEDKTFRDVLDKLKQEILDSIPKT